MGAASFGHSSPTCYTHTYDVFHTTTAHCCQVYCMPLPKRPGARVPTCAPDSILKNMRLLLGLEILSEE